MRRLDHAVGHTGELIFCVCTGPYLGKSVGVDDLLGRHERLLGAPSQNMSSKNGSRPEELAVAAHVGPVHVDQRDVEVERRHRDELFAVVVGRRHGLERRVESSSRRSRARPGSDRNGIRHAAAMSPSRNIPSSNSVVSTAPGLLALRKCGSSGIESSDTNRRRPCAPCPRRTTARLRVRRTRRCDRSFKSRTQNRAHERHRFAA